jgi:hypothetical protein
VLSKHSFSFEGRLIVAVSITQISKLKTRLPEIVNNYQDKLLTQILEDAEAEILDHTNRTVLLPKMEPLQRELAIIYYNRIGSEGVTSQSQGGVSVSYSTDIPEDIRKRIQQYVRLKVSNYET